MSDTGCFSKIGKRFGLESYFGLVKQFLCFLNSITFVMGIIIVGLEIAAVNDSFWSKLHKKDSQFSLKISAIKTFAIFIFVLNILTIASGILGIIFSLKSWLEEKIYFGGYSLIYLAIFVGHFVFAILGKFLLFLTLQRL